MAKYESPISQLRHPDYIARLTDWVKWRTVYEGGDDFVQRYLVKFSSRERNSDFAKRKLNSPIPSFAKTAINEVKNSIFQRMSDIVRDGGSEHYQEAVRGEGPGVDQRGSTMNAFIGQNILPELLTMSRVGVYVDMPPVQPGASMRETADVQPYLYMYRVEDICSWASRNPYEPDDFQALLLKDRCIDYDANTFLAAAQVERYRHIWIDPTTGKVNIQFYSVNGDPVSRDGSPGGGPEELQITQIPFAMFNIQQSLLEDVANHQIALLNLLSSDVAYALKSNFPFYIEQADEHGSSHLVKEGANPSNTATDGGQQATTQEIEVGAVQGRLYAPKMNAPAFINPSPEPLQISMQLRADLKEEIRQLVNLALTNINPKMASAESKSMDQQGLESGLSFIGLVLENGERRIARYWAAYEATKPATVAYPQDYSLKSDAERRQEAKDHADIMFKVPSRSFQRQVAKDIVDIVHGAKVSITDLQKMKSEIDDANYGSSDPLIIASDIESGLVGPQTASIARGYDDGEWKEAQAAQVQRLALIQEAQTPHDQGAPLPGARGIPDAAPVPGQGSLEKVGKPTRGAGAPKIAGDE